MHTDSFILATDDVVLVFIVGGGQRERSHTVGASWVNGEVPVILTDISGRISVSIFDDSGTFVVLEFLVGRVKGGPSNGVEDFGNPVWVLLHNVLVQS